MTEPRNWELTLRPILFPRYSLSSGSFDQGSYQKFAYLLALKVERTRTIEIVSIAAISVTAAVLCGESDCRRPCHRLAPRSARSASSVHLRASANNPSTPPREPATAAGPNSGAKRACS